MADKEIIIPAGWEVDKIENGRIVLKESRKGLPATWEECVERLAPDGDGKRDFLEEVISPLVSLCKLVLHRNAWWELMDWRPDWTDEGQVKYVIWISENEIYAGNKTLTNEVLAFPTADLRDKFLEDFGELIEDAARLMGKPVVR